jgi:hypothetical protein
MSADPWKTLAAVPPEALADASLELHWAALVLASAGQTFVDARPDDSHRSMTWDGPGGALLGEPFSGPYPFRVALAVDGLALELRDGTGRVLSAFPLAGRTLGGGYDWLRRSLAPYMGTFPEIGRPEFEVPPHAVGAGVPFSAGRGAERVALAALYGSAADVLAGVATRGPDGSAVRCWPHHFDIATLLTVRPPEGDAPARTVGVGMAPMGGGYAAWYWYVTPWPYPDPSGLPTLTAGGSWHTTDWVGAVLPGDAVVGWEAGSRSRRVRDFIDEAVRASINALGG